MSSNTGNGHSNGALPSPSVTFTASRSRRLSVPASVYSSRSRVQIIRENGSSRDDILASPNDIPYTMNTPADSVQQRGIPVANESPSLRRAGLLQARSYNPSSFTAHELRLPHSQDTIRSTTMELSNMLLSHSPREAPVMTENNLLHESIVSEDSFDIHLASSPPDNFSVDSLTQPSSSLSSDATSVIPSKTPCNTSVAPGPSGLSLLRQEYDLADEETATPRQSSPSPSSPQLSRPPSMSPQRSSSTSKISQVSATATEATPLLSSPSGPPSKSAMRIFVSKYLSPQSLRDMSKTAVRSLPAVLLGCLLNILDGVSYGMIIFPASGVFAGLGSMGVSMFFLTAVLSQLCYTFGGSGFAGANGSMMIEVVPFFHILASSIAEQIGEDERPREVIATTLVAYAFSSILTGLSFFLLGALKLGSIIGFFPRHILVGCIGGVGAFLVETGLTVSLRIDDDDFQVTWEMFKFMFFDPHNLALWTIPLLLAVILRLITSKWHHQLIFPLYFLVIPMFFYVIVAAARLNLGDLRNEGWLFDMGTGGEDKWYKFYTYFDFGLVRWGPLWSTLPTQFALLFFNILHPPLNVPALSVSLNEDVDTNKELVAHGYSNLIAGIFGTVPNYLVYVNTLLFYRVGGDTRIAGFLLAVANVLLLLLGTGPIAFIPVMVVGALIFVLGLDLMKEALWDTRHRVSKTEYLTIVSIIVAMTVWDFVIGVLFGIVMSCFFFVIQNSQRRSIRVFHTGETAMSTVRRPSSQRAYIKEVSKQTAILRLQGFLFFGTITYVEEAIRNLIEGPSWQRSPVRFLVLDLTMVGGVDMSSAEAFVRIQRLLSAKYVTLVFCGFSAESAVGRALQSVDVLGTDGVELFSTFNDAMEWTENAYLRAWFRSRKSETVMPFILPSDTRKIEPFGSFVGSPRHSHLQEAATRTIANELHPPTQRDEVGEPYNTLVRAFSSYGEINYEEIRPLLTYLERISVPERYVLWEQDDASDGLYLIECGVLRATYHFADHSPSIEESMVPGTLAGELSALSGLPRNATVTVERPAVLWKLSVENLHRLEEEEPATARLFVQLVLKSAKIDYDILLSALATRQ